MTALSIGAAASSFVWLVLVVIPYERRRRRLALAADAIALFQRHGLARDGDELTLLLAAGTAPRRALRRLGRSRRDRPLTPGP